MCIRDRSCLLALRHAGLAGSLCHGSGHSLGHAGVERAGDDVLLAAVGVSDEAVSYTHLERTDRLALAKCA